MPAPQRSAQKNKRSRSAAPYDKNARAFPARVFIAALYRGIEQKIIVPIFLSKDTLRQSFRHFHLPHGLALRHFIGSDYILLLLCPLCWQIS
jgi:hypothetical protein